MPPSITVNLNPPPIKPPPPRPELYGVVYWNPDYSLWMFSASYTEIDKANQLAIAKRGCSPQVITIPSEHPLTSPPSSSTLLG